MSGCMRIFCDTRIAVCITLRVSARGHRFWNEISIIRRAQCLLLYFVLFVGPPSFIKMGKFVLGEYYGFRRF
jgi:hypothetical protein